MAITCTHISLSPDKWECVEFNIRKEVEGSKAKKRKVSLPRVRQCGTRQHNAFREQWKDETAFVLVATAHYCQRIRQRVTRAAILLDKCPELVEACNLYESVNQAIEHFI